MTTMYSFPASAYLARFTNLTPYSQALPSHFYENLKAVAIFIGKSALEFQLHIETQ
jgi:hypothetical protein